MKIRFVRSGGFAGVRLALELDTAELASEEAAHLAQLIETARPALAQTTPSPAGPDRFEYELTIESDQRGRETHVLREPDVPEAARPLIERLTAMARRRDA